MILTISKVGGGPKIIQIGAIIDHGKYKKKFRKNYESMLLIRYTVKIFNFNKDKTDNGNILRW